ncbi:SpoIVB peptidase S55 domain-containing protein [Isoptericola aurantiacus]|uniref:SpoIVB peptidase S55 domain-containing protein n=1 Tax=Isoptericola aurantiacus TaxID=3377839 RepID=UPI00383AC046
MMNIVPGGGTAPSPATRGEGATVRRDGSGRPRRRTALRHHRVAAPIASGAAGALALGILVTALPAAAAPAPDCATAYPVADLGAGMAVHGLTVSRGTTPEAFTGELIGVLKDGIGPGLDMIVADLDSPAIDAAGGIWQGMSGSPVYAEDGRLIGAVAYGLAWGGSPVAGITPFEDMQGYLGVAAAAPTVEIGPRMAARIAAETEVTTSQAARGLAQLPMPVGVSGVDLGRADKAATARGSALIGADSYRIGRSSGSSAATVDTVVAGGNVAAVLSYGDVTLAGIGTATSVCGDRVVAFGHPMSFTGRTRLGLAAADALYVQEDPLGVPFKVANLGELGGTVTDDRLAGIAGTLGPVPTSAVVTSKVAYEGRSRAGSTEVLHRSALADVTLLGALANHDRVVDGIIAGSQTQSWTIKGTVSGEPFVLRYADRYRSGYDIGFDGVFDLATVVDRLSTRPGVKVTAVTNDVRTRDAKHTYRVVKIQQRSEGRWRDVTDRTAKVRAGATLKLRTTLQGSDGSTRTVREDVKIPKSLRGTSGSATIVGGNRVWDDFSGPRTFAEMKTLLRTNLRNDEVGLSLRIGRGKAAFERERTSDPLPRVVGGQQSVTVKVVG